MTLTKAEVLDFGHFKQARKQSLRVKDFSARIGAVLSRNGCPIAIGRNHPRKTHPIVHSYNCLKTIHAEFDVIIGINRNLAIGSTLFLYREKQDGTLAISKPCPMCEKFLRHSGVKRVYYTTASGYEMYTF